MPEPPLEVGDEDDPFPGCRGGLDLARGTPAFDAFRDPSGLPQPGDLGVGHLGPFPSGALAFFGVVVRGVPRHYDKQAAETRVIKISSVQIYSEAVKD